MDWFFVKICRVDLMIFLVIQTFIYLDAQSKIKIFNLEWTLIWCNIKIRYLFWQFIHCWITKSLWQILRTWFLTRSNHMVNAESVANASHRTRVEKSLKEKAIFNQYQFFYKSFIYLLEVSRSWNKIVEPEILPKNNPTNSFSILTTRKYLKHEFWFQVSNISESSG